MAPKILRVINLELSTSALEASTVVWYYRFFGSECRHISAKQLMLLLEHYRTDKIILLTFGQEQCLRWHNSTIRSTSL